jgi:hypothetical protein
VGLLELVEEEDGEGLLADLGDQRGGLLVRRVRVPEEAVEALRSLVLAHVQADEPVLRAEHQGAEGLRNLRLAGARRSDEEKDAERSRGVGEARLDERDPVDEALDRLRLPEHPSPEVRAHSVEAQRRPRVEHVERQPGRVAEGRDHGLRVDRVGDAAGDPVADELEHAQDVPGEAAAGR